MNDFIQTLKRKGPGGIPIWGWAAITAVVLYLGYRWFQNRSGGSSSNAVDTSGSDQTPVDTSAVDSGVPPDTSTSGDVVGEPPVSTDVAPPAGDSTSVINGAVIGAKPPEKKKKEHKGVHDHKQGVHHTNHKPIHRRRKGKKQTEHAHAPRVNKKPHSHSKSRVTKNVRNPRVRAGGHPPREPVPVTTEKRAKELPRPIAVHPHEVKHPKQPPRKRRRG